MNSRTFSPVFPAVAIALGATAAISQPSYAYSTDSASSYPDAWRDRDSSTQLPDMDQPLSMNPSNYHYAYYYIAKPEYLL